MCVCARSVLNKVFARAMCGLCLRHLLCKSTGNEHLVSPHTDIYSVDSIRSAVASSNIWPTALAYPQQNTHSSQYRLFVPLIVTRMYGFPVRFARVFLAEAKWVGVGLWCMDFERRKQKWIRCLMIGSMISHFLDHGCGLFPKQILGTRATFLHLSSVDWALRFCIAH